MMPVMEPEGFWQKIEAFLQKYERAYAPVRWFGEWGGLTTNRQGYFVFLRFIFLVGLYVAAYYLPLYAWSKIALTSLVICLIADMFILPTSYAFGGIPFPRPLRALVFVFINYVSICIAFGVLYVSLCRTSFNIDPDLIDLAYFSFTTMTALGLGDIVPGRHTLLVKFLVVSEVLIGLYFWAVLVGMIISWRVRETRNAMSLPK
jgi:hypothetical protein